MTVSRIDIFFPLHYWSTILQRFHRDLQWFCSNLITKFCFCSLCCIKFVLTFAPFIFTTDGMIPTKISVEEDDHHEGKSHLCFKISVMPELSDHLTLFQPSGTDSAILLSAPPTFFTFRHHWILNDRQKHLLFRLEFCKNLYAD